jgi:Helicase conserved C-terminal domain/CW-type Zinc Finger
LQYDTNWWQKVPKAPVAKLKDLKNGNKFVALLHILAFCSEIGDKVLVFSQCLKTLDFIEEVLAYEDWNKHLPSLSKSFDKKRFGGWKKDIDYLRIDGEVSSYNRGKYISQFNSITTNENFKAFLISSKAGGVGINLTAANRVVLFDIHFNPTVSSQAIHRAYRYGQKKPVYAYSLMAEGTAEENVYSRGVNKSSVGLRVVDNRTTTPQFTEKEIADLDDNFCWVQCDACDQWRVLIDKFDEEGNPIVEERQYASQFEGEDIEWYCPMNTRDPLNCRCDQVEKDKDWYIRTYYSGIAPGAGADADTDEKKTVGASTSPEQLLESDDLLKHIVEIVQPGKGSKSIVSRHHLHEDLLESFANVVDDESEVEIDAEVNNDNSSDANSDSLQRTMGEAVAAVDAVPVAPIDSAGELPSAIVSAPSSAVPLELSIEQVALAKATVSTAAGEENKAAFLEQQVGAGHDMDVSTSDSKLPAESANADEATRKRKHDEIITPEPTDIVDLCSSSSEDEGEDVQEDDSVGNGDGTHNV